MNRLPTRVLLALGLLQALWGAPQALAATGSVFPTPTPGDLAVGFVMMCYPNGSNQAVPCSSSTPLAIAGTFSASLAGWQPTPSYSQLAASDALNHSVAVPTGPDDVVMNLDTSVVYCNPGAAATVNSYPIQPGSAVAWHNPSGSTFTTIQCLSPSSTLKVTIAGGTGLWTGSGGGGGGGGSGGNVNVTQWDTTALGAPTAFGTQPTGNVIGANASVTYAPVPTPTTGNITVVDSGTTCASTPTNQTDCTGTPTPGSFVQATINSSGFIGVTGSISGGTATMALTMEVSQDGVNWYGRGLFLDSNNAPIWKNGLVGVPFSGLTAGGGVAFYRVRASTFTVLTGTPVVAISIRQGVQHAMSYIGNLPTGANGTNSVAALSVQGNGTTASPVNTNAQQQANVALGAPQVWGTPPTGLVVPSANTNVLASVLPTGAATAANQEVTAAGVSATSAQGVQGVTNGVPMPTAPTTSFGAAFPTVGRAVGAEYLSSPPSYSSGNLVPFQTDVNGNLKVNVAVGGGTGGTSSTYGAAFPGTGTAAGFEYLSSAPTLSSGQMVAGQTDVNGNLKVNIAAGAGPVTSAGTSATSAMAVQGVTGGTPMPVNSLFLPTGTPRIHITSATTTQLVAAVSGKAIYVTSWNVSAASGTFELEYGTQTTTPCDTGATVLAGPYTLSGGQIGVGTGTGIVESIPASNQLCAVTTAGTYDGSMAFLQQ